MFLWGFQSFSDISVPQTSEAKNPAYLGYNENIELLFTYDGSLRTLALKLGNAEVARDEKNSLWILGCGGKVSRVFYWGTKYFYSDRWKFQSYILGTTIHPTRNLVSLSLIANPKYKEYGFGIGLRPKTKNITIFYDFISNRESNVRENNYRVGLHLEPISGLRFASSFDKNRNISIGISIQFSHIRIAAEKSEQSYLSGLQISSLPFQSIFRGTRKTLNVDFRSGIEENPRSVFKKPLRYYELLDAINRAAISPEISTIFVDLSAFNGSFAHAEELRGMFARAKEKGKKIIFYSNSLGNIGYYIASIGDQIIIPPSGNLYIYGLRIEAIFLKGLFEKLGIKAEFVSIGKYKSAAEMFTRKEMSDEAKEEYKAIADDIYEHLILSIASGRKLSVDSVKSLVDEGIFNAEKAKQAGLVDTILFFDDAKKLVGKSSIDIQKFVSAKKLDENWGEPNKIAIIYAQGAIVDAGGGISIFGSENISSEAFVKTVKEIEKNRGIKGVVLRIDSPGGSALGSDIILNSLIRLAKKKPLVISMSSYAASGGYMISCVGEKIFSDATTITGSIGVVSGKFALLGLFEKLGVSVDTIQRGKSAAIFSVYDTLTPELLSRLKSDAEYFYNLFIEKVSSARNMPYDSVLNIAEGRIYSGKRALAIGLVDTIGTIYDAVNYIASNKNLGRDFEPRYFPKRKEMLTELISSLLFSKTSRFKAMGSDILPFRTGQPLYLSPYLLHID